MEAPSRPRELKMEMKSNLFIKWARNASGVLPLVAGLAFAVQARGEPLVYLPFNEGTGNFVTDTASGLAGLVVVGSPQNPETDIPLLVDDSPSGAANDRSVTIRGNGYLAAFDTNNPVLAFPADQPFTIEAWVSTDPAPDPQFLKANEGILTYGGVYKLGLRSQKLTFTLFGEADMADPTDAQLVFANGWHHVAAAFEPGVGVTLYLDGVPSFVENTDTVPAYANNILFIGAERGNNNILANLDRVRVHRGLLTPEQLDTNPTVPKPAYENTVLSYNFNETQLPAQNEKSPALATLTSVELASFGTWTEDDPEDEAGDFSIIFDGLRRVTVEDTNLVINTDNFLDYTLEAWVKTPTNIPTARAIIMEYRGNPGFAMSINNDGTLHTTTFRIRDIATPAQVPFDDAWHHLAVVHQNGVEMRFYVDGQLLHTEPYTSGPGNQSTPRLTIGMASSGANVFNGLIDRVRISNTALSPTEFDADFEAGAPLFSGQPEDAVVPVGGSATFTPVFTATSPRTLQWLFRPFEATDATPIVGATSATLTVSNAQGASQGFYSLVVSNAAGQATSTEAQLTLQLSPTRPDTLERVWVIQPGERDYITIGDPSDSQRNNLERGMAYNPVTDHVLVVARETSPILKGVYVLDADTGAEVGQLDITGIEGGTIVLIKPGVADDGAIYAANFGSFNPTGTQTTIYRWANESAAPTIAFKGNPTPGGANEQWGKNFAVRGSGVDTQILMETRRQVLALFTTTNGVDFTPTVLQSTAPTDAFSHGIAFGPGNTFFGKAVGEALYHMSFDPAAGTATPLHIYPEAGNRLAGIDVDLGKNLLAGISVQDGPDALELYDISDTGGMVDLLDAELFPVDNANTVIGGNAAFGSNNMVFALDTNNGLVAYRIKPGTGGERLQVARQGNQLRLSWATAGAVLESTTALGSNANWTPVAGTDTATEHVTDFSGSARFFRLRR